MRFVSNTTSAILRYRIVLAIFLGTLLGVAICLVGRVKYSSDIFALLPTKDSYMQTCRVIGEKIGGIDTIYFNIATTDSNLADKLIGELKRQGFTLTSSIDDIQKVPSELLAIYPSIFTDSAELEKSISRSEIEKRIKFYMRKMSGFESALYKDAFMQDPMGVIPITLGELKSLGKQGLFSGTSNGAIVSMEKNNILIIARAPNNSIDYPSAKKNVYLAKLAIDAVLIDYPSAKISMAGAPIIAVDNAEIARADSVRCTLITAILMLLLCLFAFNCRIFAFAVVLPPFLASVFAIAIASFLFGEISAISVAFAGIVMGVGADYAIHILASLDGKGKVSTCMAVNASMTFAKPIFVICTTTLIAFLIISLMGGGMAQFGILGICGITFCAILAVFVLPVFCVGLGSVSQKDTLFVRIAMPVADFIERHPRIFIFIAILITIIAFPFALRVSFDGKISSMNALSNNYASQDAEIRTIWASAISNPLVAIKGDDVNDALKKTEDFSDKFIKKYPNANLSPILNIVPSEVSAKRNVKNWNAFWNEQRIANFAKDVSSVSKSLGINPAMFEPAIKKLEAKPNAMRGVYDCSTLKKIISARIIEDETMAIVLLPIELNAGLSKSDVAKMVDSVGGAIFFDSEYLGEYVSNFAESILLKSALWAFCAAAVFLTIALRNYFKTICVLACVAIGLLWGFAIMTISGVNITLTNSIFVVFSVCLAQDYAVMMLYAVSKHKSVKEAVSPVLISATTTIVAFVALAWATHPVIEGLGKAAVISITSILFATFLIVPTLCKILSSKIYES